MSLCGCTSIVWCFVSVKPGFSSANWLFLGKTHQQMGHKDEARRWLQQVMEKEYDGPQHKEVSDSPTLLLADWHTPGGF